METTNFKILLVLLFTISLFFPTLVRGTGQQPDIIYYKDSVYSLQSNPLRLYFKMYPDKEPETKIITSNLWRGYITTYIIKDSLLFIKDISIKSNNSKNKMISVFNKVFPNNNLVMADWYNGYLVIPYGHIVQYVHSGFETKYSNYYVLQIFEGKIVKEENFDLNSYIGFIESKFELFKLTNEYKEKKMHYLKSEYVTDETADNWLKESVLVYLEKVSRKYQN